jgi:TIR domain/SIR2-like domain
MFPDTLVEFMAEGRVIPIIGADLSIIEAKGTKKTVYQLLAERLAVQLAIPANRLPPNLTLTHVVCAFPEYRDDPSTVYGALKHAYAQEPIPLPVSLRKLAQIPAFPLYVNTSFDGLLAQALLKERGAMNRVTYFPKSKCDLDSGPLHADQPVLFELFGRITANVEEYALTEDDVLEFVHAMQTEALRPSRLFARMRESHLLFIGNGFPDWLARFFLRITKDSCVSSLRRKKEFIVDSAILHDVRLTEFLKYFSRETTMVSTTDLEAFVEELHRRWFNKFPAAAISQRIVAPSAALARADEQQAGVFISYASEDRPAALRVKEHLEEIGWIVWLDQSGGLAGGDEFDKEIQDNISACALFLPLISPHVATPRPGQDRYYRQEWAWALERLRRFTAMDWPFIIPVKLGPVIFEAAQVPKEFLKRTWVAASSEGSLPHEFLGEMQTLIRRLRKNPI